jgi:hypothetical protein
MSLNIFYTGANVAGGEQAEPRYSLGGYISSSPVPNNYFGNLFTAISQLSEQNEVEETKAIAIQNNSGADFTAFQVYVNAEDCSDLQTLWDIGYQVPVLDDCGDLVSEELPNSGSTPLNVTMQNGLGVNNKLILPNIVDQNYVILYIRRTIKVSSLTDDDIINNYEDNIVPEKEEKIGLVFSWT